MIRGDDEKRGGKGGVGGGERRRRGQDSTRTVGRTNDTRRIMEIKVTDKKAKP